MFDKLNFNMVKIVLRSTGYFNLEVVMFKWQKKILSLLVMAFMFSSGIICGAIEDYLIYFGCEETNCSKCKKSLACKDCISNFPAALSLVCNKDTNGNIKKGEYRKGNFCFIPFERINLGDINVQEIYQNTAMRFCGNCMLGYFVDKFHETNPQNFINWEAIYEQYVYMDCETLEGLKVKSKYDEFVKNFGSEAKDFPFPMEFVSSREFNSYKCRDCNKLFFTSFQSLISRDGYRICPYCEGEIEKNYEKYIETKKINETMNETWNLFFNDYRSLRLRIPCISGNSILNMYKRKYEQVKENSKRVEKLGKVVKKPGIKREEQKK